MTGRATTIDVEVRYAETDQMGVVHHAAYVVWFELARTALCRETGFHYAEIERLGHLLMVTGVEVRYAKPARYGDTVQVACALERLASRALRFAYEVSREGTRLATGASDHLWVDRATGRPCRIPEVLRPGFEALRGDHSPAGKPGAGGGVLLPP
jgi:acyl-CoA thioester hydrolase